MLFHTKKTLKHHHYYEEINNSIPLQREIDLKKEENRRKVSEN